MCKHHHRIKNENMPDKIHSATGLKGFLHQISAEQRFSYVQSSSPKKNARPSNVNNVGS